MPNTFFQISLSECADHKLNDIYDDSMDDDDVDGEMVMKTRTYKE